MTSVVLRPVPRLLVDLTGLTAGGVATVFLARRIDVTAYKEITALLRFHGGTFVDKTPAIAELNILADGYTPEDPAALDAAGNPAFQVKLTSFNISAPSVGAMTLLAVPPNFGSLLSLSIGLTAGAVGPLKYVISLDLVCKEF